MIRVRRSADRGRVQHGWLDSRHSFSFGSYYDPEHLGFRGLRVINEDWVEPGTGFGTHPHRDMEILTYVVSGAVEHRDSTGGRQVVRAGDLQRMSAGTGIEHSEQNRSTTERLHMLQIWILPERASLPPGYEQRSFPPDERRGELRLVAAHDARDGALRVHQDVDVWAGLLPAGATASRPIARGRHAWIQLVRGALSVEGQVLRAGDGAALSEVVELRLAAEEESELLLFDLA
jgi:redox-sensitive bicupin YhaK (pirin superfamily)